MFSNERNVTQFSLTVSFGFVTIAANLCGLYFTPYAFRPLLAWFELTTVAFLLARYFHHWQLGVVCGFMFGWCVLGIPYCVMEGHSVALQRLDRVRIGATADYVESVLGSPTSIATDPVGQTWLYSGPTWCHVKIRFNARNQVTDIDHDH